MISSLNDPLSPYFPPHQLFSSTKAIKIKSHVLLLQIKSNNNAYPPLSEKKILRPSAESKKTLHYTTRLSPCFTKNVVFDIHAVSHSNS